MGDNEIQKGSRVVALVRDLMFAARVRGSAPDAVVAQDGARARAAVGSATRLVLVELEAADALELIEGVVGEGGPAVVAFAPHVRAELLERAEAAGARVMTRGGFVKQLPQLVAGAGT